MKRRGLGSGLEALLPAESPGGVREVSVEQIRQNPRQPRTYFDEAALEELTASIREHGIIQPLIVSERDGWYELVAGERRWRAAQRAGVSRVPVVVRETTPQQLLEIALIENVQRADLNPLEEAHAYEALKAEFNLSDDEIARRVGKNNRVTITNTRRLLKLPAAAQEALLKQSITAGHGRALLKLEHAEQQAAALQAIVDDELSVREAEYLGDLVKKTDGDVARAVATIRRQRASRVGGQRPADAPASPPRRADTSADDQAIAEELQRIIGTPVNLSRSGKELRVTIVFYDDEKVQEFFDTLSGTRSI